MIKAKIAVTLSLLAALSVSEVNASPESDRAEPVSHYAIDTDESWLRVLVYRGGLIGGLGHNHVISHTQISGQALLDNETQQAEFSLELSVHEFVVDDPVVRKVEGDDFPGEMSAKNIDGTKSNMLGPKLLDAQNFPTVRVHAADISLHGSEIEVVVVLRGEDFKLNLPVTIRESENGWTVIGTSSISHGDIGLSPFKAALGMLRVRDELELKYELHLDEIGIPSHVDDDLLP